VKLRLDVAQKRRDEVLCLRNVGVVEAALRLAVDWWSIRIGLWLLLLILVVGKGHRSIILVVVTGIASLSTITSSLVSLVVPVIPLWWSWATIVRLLPVVSRLPVITTVVIFPCTISLLWICIRSRSSRWRIHLWIIRVPYGDASSSVRKPIPTCGIHRELSLVFSLIINKRNLLSRFKG